jgi:hypothetical protein
VALPGHAGLHPAEEEGIMNFDNNDDGLVPQQVQDISEVPTPEEVSAFAHEVGIPIAKAESVFFDRPRPGEMRTRAFVSHEEALLTRGAFTDGKGRMRLNTAVTPKTIPEGLAQPSDDEHDAWVMREPFWLASDLRVVPIRKMDDRHLLNTINHLRRAVDTELDSDAADAFDPIGFSWMLVEARNRGIFRENNGYNRGIPGPCATLNRRVFKRVKKAAKVLREEMRVGLNADLHWELQLGNDHSLRHRMGERARYGGRDVNFARKRAFKRIVNNPSLLS